MGLRIPPAGGGGPAPGQGGEGVLGPPTKTRDEDGPSLGPTVAGLPEGRGTRVTHSGLGTLRVHTDRDIGVENVRVAPSPI